LSATEAAELNNYVQAKWGFLENIVNINKFFGSHGDGQSLSAKKSKVDNVAHGFIKNVFGRDAKPHEVEKIIASHF